MKYDSYKYLFPPRPEKQIPPSALGFYENLGFWAQVKKNGTNTVIFAKGKEVVFKTRHQDENHRQWSPLPEHIKFFQSDSTEWNVFCAELIHSKTPHIKNQLYIYDQIVEDGIHLIGTRFEDRQLNLHARWTTLSCTDDQRRVHPNVTVAKNYTGKFASLFNNLKPEDEGLVLKDPKGILRVCFSANANRTWQVKARIPHKNYSF